MMKPQHMTPVHSSLFPGVLVMSYHQYGTMPPGYGGFVHIPNPNDVLCGRGGRINAHGGNVNFRKIVLMYKEDYLSKSAGKNQKAQIAAHVVTRIRTLNPSGRFLKVDGDTGCWIEMGDEKARKKAGQALREDSAKFRLWRKNGGGSATPTDGIKSTDSGKSKRQAVTTSPPEVVPTETLKTKHVQTSNKNKSDICRSSQRQDQEPVNLNSTSDTKAVSQTVPVSTVPSHQNVLTREKSSRTTPKQHTQNDGGFLSALKASSDDKAKKVDSINPIAFSIPGSKQHSLFSTLSASDPSSINQQPQVNGFNNAIVDYFKRKSPASNTSSSEASSQYNEPGSSLKKSYPLPDISNMRQEKDENMSVVSLSNIEPNVLSGDDKTIDSYTLKIVMNINDPSEKITTNTQQNFSEHYDDDSSPPLTFRCIANMGTLAPWSSLATEMRHQHHHQKYQDPKEQVDVLSKELGKLRINQQEKTPNEFKDKRLAFQRQARQSQAMRKMKDKLIEDSFSCISGDADTSAEYSSTMKGPKITTHGVDKRKVKGNKTKKGGDSKQSLFKSSSSLMSFSIFTSLSKLFRKKSSKSQSSAMADVASTDRDSVSPEEAAAATALSVLGTPNISLRDLLSIGSESLSALCNAGEFEDSLSWMKSFRTMMSVSTVETNISDLTSDLVSLERKVRDSKRKATVETARC